MKKTAWLLIALILGLALLLPRPAKADQLIIGIAENGGDSSMEGAWVTLLAKNGQRMKAADYQGKAEFQVASACADLKYPLTIQVYKPGFKVTTEIYPWHEIHYICHSYYSSIHLWCEREQNPAPDPSTPPGNVKVFLERQGSPVAGELVRLFNARLSRMLASDAQGYAEFTGVPPADDYTVTVNPQNLQPANWTGIRVQSGQTVTLIKNLD